MAFIYVTISPRLPHLQETPLLYLNLVNVTPQFCFLLSYLSLTTLLHVYIPHNCVETSKSLFSLKWTEDHLRDCALRWARLVSWCKTGWDSSFNTPQLCSFHVIKWSMPCGSAPCTRNTNPALLNLVRNPLLRGYSIEKSCCVGLFQEHCCSPHIRPGRGGFQSRQDPNPTRQMVCYAWPSPLEKDFQKRLCRGLDDPSVYHRLTHARSCQSFLKGFWLVRTTVVGAQTDDSELCKMNSHVVVISLIQLSRKVIKILRVNACRTQQEGWAPANRQLSAKPCEP